MSRMNSSVLVVGAIPATDAATAMRLCAEGLGGLIACLPDGETGRRRLRTTSLAAMCYHGHSCLETVAMPCALDATDPGEWRRSGDEWLARGDGDQWRFQLRANRGPLQFEGLGYAAAAKESYPTFCDLRDAGVIHRDMRFTVAMPLAESAVRPFAASAADYAAMAAAYTAALHREVEDLTNCIPANDLVVQWDISRELLAAEAARGADIGFAFELPGEPVERFVGALSAASRLVPPRTLLGLRFAYGECGHAPRPAPVSLAVATDLAAAALAALSRPVDYCHFPVPRERDDDDYFLPLETFAPADAKIYLGLVHEGGDCATLLALLKTAARHASGFGIATECGFGVSRESLGELIDIHHRVAEHL